MNQNPNPNPRPSGPMIDLRKFFLYSRDMLCVLGADGYFKQVSPSFERILGFSHDAALAQSFAELIHPDDMEATLLEIRKLTVGERTLLLENRCRCEDGTYKHLHWTMYPDEGGLMFCIVRDLTELRRMESVIRDLSRVDEETGVATQRVFNEVLRSEWHRARRLAIPMAVAVIELDDLESYVEIHGYMSGAECLRRVAAALPSHARRAGDLVARYGSDGLAIVWGNVDSRTASTLCRRISNTVAGLEISHPGSSSPGSITASVGAAAMLPTGTRDPDSLLAAAAAACSEARARGPGNVVVHRAS